MLDTFSTQNNPKQHLAMQVAAALATNTAVMSLTQKVAQLQAARDSSKEAAGQGVPISERDLVETVAQCVVKEVVQQISEQAFQNKSQQEEEDKW